MVHTIALHLLTSWEHSFALCFLWLIPAGNYSCPLSNSFPLLNYLHIFGIALSLCTKNILNIVEYWVEKRNHFFSYFQVLSTYYVVDIFKVWKMSSHGFITVKMVNGQKGSTYLRESLYYTICTAFYYHLLTFMSEALQISNASVTLNLSNWP